MHLVFATFVGLTLASGAFALECPAPGVAPAWHQFGCEMADGTDLGLSAVSALAGDQTEGWEAAVLMIDALDRRGRVLRLHVQSTAQDIVAGVNALLLHAQSTVLTSQETEEIAALTANTGEPMVDSAPYLEKIVAARGKHLVLIDTSTDFETLAFLDNTEFCRWNRVNIASGVSLSQVTAVDVGEDYFDAQTWPTGPRECEGMRK